MLDYNFPRKPRFSPFSQLAILLMLVGLLFLFSGLVLALLVSSWLHVPPGDLQEALLKPTNTNITRFLQCATTFFGMALPAYVFARIMSRQGFEYLGFNSALTGKQVFIIVGIVFIGIIVSVVLSEVNEVVPISKSAETYFRNLEEEYTKQMIAIANMKTTQDYIVSLFIIALLPALFEEMLFRGSLQPVLISITRNAFAGILITSILFSAIHMSYYGFLPRLALGLMIGYVFYFSKNLWLSIITHFLYNAFGVTQIYALSKAGQLNADSMNETLPLYYGLLAFPALLAIFYIFKRESELVVSMYNLSHMPEDISSHDNDNSAG